LRIKCKHARETSADHRAFSSSTIHGRVMVCFILGNQVSFETWFFLCANSNKQQRMLQLR